VQSREETAPGLRTKHGGALPVPNTIKFTRARQAPMGCNRPRDALRCHINVICHRPLQWGRRPRARAPLGRVACTVATRDSATECPERGFLSQVSIPAGRGSAVRATGCAERVSPGTPRHPAACLCSSCSLKSRPPPAAKTVVSGRDAHKGSGGHKLLPPGFPGICFGWAIMPRAARRNASGPWDWIRPRRCS
jgi:hypothetical protein